MADEATPDQDDLRAQLADVNDQIATLGGEADDSFAEAGGETTGAIDSEDTAADLTMAQENEALLQPLYERRRNLTQALTQS